MTPYKHRVTVACPISLVTEANHLAATLGESMADIRTYRETPNAWDAQGNPYSLISTVATDSLLIKSSADPVRPAFDTQNEIDLTKAKAASDVVVIFNDADLAGEEPAEPILAAPEQITAYIMQDHNAAIGLMGLTATPPQESE